MHDPADFFGEAIIKAKADSKKREANYNRVISTLEELGIDPLYFNDQVSPKPSDKALSGELEVVLILFSRGSIDEVELMSRLRELTAVYPKMLSVNRPENILRAKRQKAIILANEVHAASSRMRKAAIILEIAKLIGPAKTVNILRYTMPSVAEAKNGRKDNV